jgi:hypothetical protein
MSSSSFKRYAQVIFVRAMDSKVFTFNVSSPRKLYTALQTVCELNYSIKDIEISMIELDFPTILSTNVNDNGGKVFISYDHDNNDKKDLDTIHCLKDNPVNIWVFMEKKGCKQTSIDCPLPKEGDIIEKNDDNEKDEENDEKEDEKGMRFGNFKYIPDEPNYYSDSKEECIPVILRDVFLDDIEKNDKFVLQMWSKTLGLKYKDIYGDLLVYNIKKHNDRESCMFDIVVCGKNVKSEDDKKAWEKEFDDYSERRKERKDKITVNSNDKHAKKRKISMIDLKSNIQNAMIEEIKCQVGKNFNLKSFLETNESKLHQAINNMIEDFENQDKLYELEDPELDLYREYLYDFFPELYEENQSEEENDENEILVIRSPEGQQCEENDGLSSCVFSISRKDWENYGKLISDNKNKSRYERDHSSGAHGCIIQFDLFDMYQKCEILDTYSDENDIPKALSKIFDNSFIEEIEDWKERKLGMTK